MDCGPVYATEKMRPIASFGNGIAKMDANVRPARPKRSEPAETGYQFGRCRVFPAERAAFIDDRRLPLSELAFEILLQLSEARGGSVERKAIADRIAACGVVEDGLIWVTVGEIRSVFGPHKGCIKSQPNGGYALTEEVILLRGEKAPKSADDPKLEGSATSAAKRENVKRSLMEAVRTFESRYSISVVDDDDSVRSAVESLLASVGLVSSSYPSIRQFSRAPRSDLTVGCIILDLRLPGEDGFSLFKEMVETSNAFPVIFLTGHGDVPTSVKAMKYGAADFLIKPVSGEELLQAVRHALENPTVQRGAPKDQVVVEASASGEDARGKLAPWQERLATEMLLKSLNDSPNLKAIADACGISRSHFGHAFKSSVGLSPYKWLSIQRIQTAKNLLLQGKPAAEVALLCGFSDQSHFNRRFAEIAGSPPGVWLRRNKV